ncbi:hypothetical protein PoB_005401700 [Plakobranchus ocellatus]|uniref:Uncharacterized protein n=1 Tax=Plakobranchus ocellatus TaxID=259542 RepID=A0AAV4C893_9GAST|nr:hypothetical protein PoB_005401700 [Plakobranchus ocellatus]
MPDKTREGKTIATLDSYVFMYPSRNEPNMVTDTQDRKDSVLFRLVDSHSQRDLRLSSLSSGQGVGGGAQKGSLQISGRFAIHCTINRPADFDTR